MLGSPTHNTPQNWSACVHVVRERQGLLTQSKVSQLDLSLAVIEDVGRLQVTMDSAL